MGLRATGGSMAHKTEEKGGGGEHGVKGQGRRTGRKG